MFTEPHAYISTKNYEKEKNVPKWNYIAIHAYGKGKVISDEDKEKSLEHIIDFFDNSFCGQWQNSPDEYKLKMKNSIVAFEIEVDKIEAKFKLSQK